MIVMSEISDISIHYYLWYIQMISLDVRFCSFHKVSKISLVVPFVIGSSPGFGNNNKKHKQTTTVNLTQKYRTPIQNILQFSFKSSLPELSSVLASFVISAFLLVSGLVASCQALSILPYSGKTGTFVITARNRIYGKVMFLHLSVILFTEDVPECIG